VIEIASGGEPEYPAWWIRFAHSLGSVANVIIFEIARERCAIGFWRFLAIGAPITVLTTAAGLVTHGCLPGTGARHHMRP